MVKNSRNFATHTPTVSVNTPNRIAYRNASAQDFPESDSPQIIRVIQIGNQKLEFSFRISLRRGHMLNNRLEKRFYIQPLDRLTAFGHFFHSVSILCAGV